MTKYGYARVSSSTQDHSSQVEALRAAGCTKIFSEKRSAKNITDRHEFARLMKTLQPGDVVHVVKLDRLARSSRDLFNILHELQALGCGFRSLGEDWCNTESDVGRLLIAVMSGVAEFERSLIKSRTEAGIKRARDKGTVFGRKAKLDAGQKRKIAERHADGETIESLALEYSVGVATIHRAVHA
jgi:DNA invertase Pin-like site-specific DNA recombinase